MAATMGTGATAENATNLANEANRWEKMAEEIVSGTDGDQLTVAKLRAAATMASGLHIAAALERATIARDNRR